MPARPTAAWCVAATAAAILATAFAAGSVATAAGKGQVAPLSGADGPLARAWVRKANAATLRRLGSTGRFDLMLSEARSVLTQSGRLGEVSVQGDHVFQYLQSQDRPLGVWRRAPLEGFIAGTPVWTPLLDLDDLSRREGRKFFLAGASCRGQRCLVNLSENGRDAHETREFDLVRRTFVRDGFAIPSSKSRAWWYSADELLVAPAVRSSDLNEHGLPSHLRLWRRGRPLSDARELFSIDPADAMLGATLIGAGRDGGFVAVRQPDFAQRIYDYVLPDGTRRRLPLPSRASILGLDGGLLLLRLDEDWSPASRNFAAGDVVGIPLSRLLDEGSVTEASKIYSPQAGESVLAATGGEDGLILTSLRNYVTRLQRLRRAPTGWRAQEVASSEPFAEVLSRRDGRLLVRAEGPLTPERIVELDLATMRSRVILQSPAAFDAAPLTTRLLSTRSADGTTVDYLVMHRRDLAADGTNPTLVYGYGGFDVPLTPRYEPLFGRMWLARGGVYVHAYLRGGGERGPAFRRATMREGHERAFQDMEAVLRDLQRRRITSPDRTGIIGRSNGGLLTAAVMERVPELVGAAVIGGPLIDMLNYHRIPPGGTWKSEYGDPDDPADRAVLLRYSPMQNVAPSSTRYPVPLIITSRDDDRVLPVHARRFSRLLTTKGHDNLYFEDEQGGHYWELGGGPAPGDWRLRAKARAVEFTYLWSRLAQPGR